MNESLYFRITDYTSIYCSLCSEYKAECPDCEHPLCVTCMDECPNCEGSLW